MTSTLEATKNLQNELDIKEQLVNALHIKLTQKQDILDTRCTEKIYAVYDTEYIIQTTNAICETYDLIQCVDKSYNI